MANRPTHTGEKEVKAFGKVFKLAYGPKVHRAIYGDESNPNAVQHGVGLDAAPEALLAEYDRIGGLILLNGKKVKTGTFWDSRRNKAIEKPNVEIQKRPTAKASIEAAGDADKKDIFASEDEDDEDEESDEETEEAESKDKKKDEEDEDDVDSDDDEEESASTAGKKAAKKK